MSEANWRSICTGNFYKLKQQKNRIHSSWGLANDLFYIDDPFVDIHVVIDYLQEWKDWSIISSKAKEHQLFPANCSLSHWLILESLLMLGLYIHDNLDQDQQAIKESFVSSILGYNEWKTVFQLRNLRLKPRKESGQCCLLLQQELERIRIDHLRLLYPQKPQNSRSKPATDTNPHTKQLVLSTCYVTILEFARISSFIVHMNLEFLSCFAESLSESWFTMDLLETMRDLLKSSDITCVDSSLKLITAHSQIAGALDIGDTMDSLKILYQKDSNLYQSAFLALLGYCNNFYHSFPFQSQSATKYKNIVLYLFTNQFKCTPLVQKNIAQLLVAVDAQDMIEFSNKLLQCPILFENESDVLKIIQIYYYIAIQYSEKYERLLHQQSYQLLGSLKRIILNTFYDSEPPEFLEYLTACYDVDTTLAAYAGLGIIQALSDGFKKGKPISERAIANIQVRLLNRLLETNCNKDGLVVLGQVTGSLDDPKSLFKTIDSTLHAPKVLMVLLKEWFTIPTIIKNCLDGNVVDDDQLQQLLSSIYFTSLGRISEAIRFLVYSELKRGNWNHIIEFLVNAKKMFESYTSFCTPTFVTWDHTSGNEKDNIDSNQQMTKAWKVLKSIFFSFSIIIQSLCDYLRTHFDELSPDQYPFITESIENVFSSYQKLSFISCRFGLGGNPIYEKQLEVLTAILFQINNSIADEMYYHNYAVDISTDSDATILYFYNAMFYLYQILNTIHFMDDEMFLQNVSRVLFHFAIVPKNIPTTSTLAIDAVRLDIQKLSHVIFLKIFESSMLYQHIVREITVPYASFLLDYFQTGIDAELFRESFQGIIGGLCDFSPATETIVVQRAVKEQRRRNLPDSQTIEFLVTKEWKKEVVNIAWKCIELLRNRIEEPTKTIPDLMQQTLMKVLFDQINVIGFQKLQELLGMIEYLMMERFDIKNQDCSILWAALYDSISDPDRIDYTRRYYCVVWFLKLYSQKSTQNETVLPINAKL